MVTGVVGMAQKRAQCLLCQQKARHWLSRLAWSLGEQSAFLTNCHYFSSSFEFTFFKTISHRAQDCLALQPMKTNGFHCSSVKGKQVYFTSWAFSSVSLNHQTCFSQAHMRAFTVISSVTVKWSRKPLSVLFHRGGGSWISTWGSTGCSLPFPL